MISPPFIMYPHLPKSYKNAFPFTLSAPSFIYPDDYIPNARLLGPFLDEIELLCFESHPSSLPSRKTVQELESLAREFRSTYNVHLPSDLCPGSFIHTEQDRFVESILAVVERTLPLTPTAYILHLPYPHSPIGNICDNAWLSRISDSLRRLNDAGMPGQAICIETLDYPLEWITHILLEHDLSVCLDLGHLIVNRQPVERTYHRFVERIKMIHLHGVYNGKDHLSLDVFNPNRLNEICSLLQQYTGTLSIEVFSFDQLLISLSVLERNIG